METQILWWIVEYDTLFTRLDSLDLTTGEEFERAREEAYAGDYEVARAIARRILLNDSEYHDVRILIGRTYAWEEKYAKAKEYFEEVLESDSTYYDVYNAYFDSEFWNGNYKNALEIIQRGLKHHPDKQEFLERKRKVLSKLNEAESSS